MAQGERCGGGFLETLFPGLADWLRDPFDERLRARLQAMRARGPAVVSPCPECPPERPSFDLSVTSRPDGRLLLEARALVTPEALLRHSIPSPLDCYGALDECYRDGAVAGFLHYARFVEPPWPPFMDCVRKMACTFVNTSPEDLCNAFAREFAKCLGLLDELGTLFIGVQQAVVNGCKECLDKRKKSSQ